MCFWRGQDGGSTGGVAGDEEVEEVEVGERLAHREGRRRLAGQAGLEKFFLAAEEETEDSSLSCGETHKLTFKIITPSREQSESATQILYILSRVPSVIFLILGETTGIFQTGTLMIEVRSCETELLLVKRKTSGLRDLTHATLLILPFTSTSQSRDIIWPVLLVEATLERCL